MKIGILSRNVKLYSTKRLVEAAEAKGHEVRVIDYLRCYMDITSKNPKVILAGESLNLDAIIPRVGASHTFYGTAVVRQFEMMRVFSANESQSITRSRDKLRSLQLLARAGVGLPVTGFAHSTKDIEGLMGVVGDAPLIIKLLEGTQGMGVVLAESNGAAESVIGAFRQLDANILVQKFVKESRGEDIRAIVINGKVIASMRRKAAEGEFRSNLHRGGSAELIKLSASERATAIKAADVLGLGVAGVDMLRSNNGPVVMEVNSSPGLEGIEKASEIDVADHIIQYLETSVAKLKASTRKKIKAG